MDSIDSQVILDPHVVWAILCISAALCFAIFQAMYDHNRPPPPRPPKQDPPNHPIFPAW